MIIFVLNLGFLCKLYLNFVFFSRLAFIPCDFFPISFYQSPPRFLLETNRFASIEDSLRIWHYATFFGRKKPEFF